MIKYILQDWHTNAGSLIARLLLVQFRLIGLLLSKRRIQFLAFPLWVFYKLYSEFFLHIELSPRASVGAGLRMPHPFGIVINVGAIIGDGCIIRHGVTVGNRGAPSSSCGHSCPVLCDRVDVGCSAVLLGGIVIGANSAIGASSVVLVDVEESSVYAGNPARRIK